MKLVILDRDGVINEDSDEYIKSADEWIPISGSIEAIAQLALEQMHQKMNQLVELAGGCINGIFFCPHLPSDQCSCRKPGTGMLEAIESSFQCSVQNKPFIGDSFKDLEAGVKKGCKPVLVLTGKGAKTKQEIEAKKPLWGKDVLTYSSLKNAVDALTQ
jgi:D-glycero-D-manno-heptose 1,7-bisphosphate phosphatase